MFAKKLDAVWRFHRNEGMLRSLSRKQLNTALDLQNLSRHAGRPEGLYILAAAQEVCCNNLRSHTIIVMCIKFLLSSMFPWIFCDLRSSLPTSGRHNVCFCILGVQHVSIYCLGTQFISTNFLGWRPIMGFYIFPNWRPIVGRLIYKFWCPILALSINNCG